MSGAPVALTRWRSDDPLSGSADSRVLPFFDPACVWLYGDLEPAPYASC